MTTPMMAMANRPANVVGASSRALATARKPMPLLPRTFGDHRADEGQRDRTFRLANR